MKRGWPPWPRPGDHLIVPGDITEDSVRSALIAKTVARWGKIDILINNAGRGSYYTASTTPLDEARARVRTQFFRAIWRSPNSPRRICARPAARS